MLAIYEGPLFLECPNFGRQFLLESQSPRAPCLSIIPTLGRKVYKSDLHWAIWSLRERSTKAGGGDQMTLACAGWTAPKVGQ